MEQRQKETKQRNLSSSNSWKKRMEGLNDSWSLWREKIFKKIVAFEGFKSSHCSSCKRTMMNFQLRCFNCKLHLCWECDRSYHFKDPFYKRFLFQTKNCKSFQLKPTQFIDSKGNLIEQGHYCYHTFLLQFHLESLLQYILFAFFLNTTVQ